MDKQKYYVSIETGEVHSQPVANAYQYEIVATPAEAARLNALFERANGHANDGFFHFRSVEEEKHKRFDETMSTIYQTLYELGDDLAKEHIDSMDVLQ